jgi:succinate-semialdehyde dehydrogenase / glutarate-semialdehyde dehydrogenase
MALVSINPTNDEELHRYPVMSSEDLEEAVSLSAAAQKDWANRPLDQRIKIVMGIGQLLRERAPKLARRMALEMGKPLDQGQAEAVKCAWVCDYYAEVAPGLLADIDIPTEAQKSYVSFHPLGLILGIMPWNFPHWQAIRYIVPALLAGNGCLMKHAPGTLGSAQDLVDICRDAGLPEHLFQSLQIEVQQVPSLIDDSRIQGVTLTGSTAAGSAVAAMAGAKIKKCVLELGGSDPALILADADLESAASVTVQSRMINNGQSCIATKRFIVVEDVFDAFADLVCKKMSEFKMGVPLDASTTLGPLARTDLRDGLAFQVDESIRQGATCLLGGRCPDGPGAFYPATVLSSVEPGSPAFDEELFGPVVSLIRAKDEKDALHLASQTVYGLGASVFTRDLERGERIARNELHAGSCFVNSIVRSDPRLPFGGVKESGFGRELSSFGLREFVNIKTVVVG